jgi:hypothetical protein
MGKIFLFSFVHHTIWNIAIIYKCWHQIEKKATSKDCGLSFFTEIMRISPKVTPEMLLLSTRKPNCKDM